MFKELSFYYKTQVISYVTITNFSRYVDVFPMHKIGLGNIVSLFMKFCQIIQYFFYKISLKLRFCKNPATKHEILFEFF